MDLQDIWLFHGSGAQFASAVFTDRQKAEDFIGNYCLSGMLTKMPINKSVCEWAMEKDYFESKEEYQKKSSFIGKFTSASLEHYHYIDGKRD